MTWRPSLPSIDISDGAPTLRSCRLRIATTCVADLLFGIAVVAEGDAHRKVDRRSGVTVIENPSRYRATAGPRRCGNRTGGDPLRRKMWPRPLRECRSRSFSWSYFTSTSSCSYSLRLNNRFRVANREQRSAKLARLSGYSLRLNPPPPSGSVSCTALE